MGKYQTPVLISYGWGCPYHGGHQRQVALAEPPKPNEVIDINSCWGHPGEPQLITKLYGSLKLEVNRATPNIKDKGDI